MTQAYGETQESEEVIVLGEDHDNPLRLQMTPTRPARQTEVTPPTGTRSPGVDLGGPYGPVNEGECILFTATVDDP
ncbi:MAG: hypothetical protein LN416_07950, partial [Candidatus Thermoplasmatota archaeon]|nr:hypothetical protein [Candidatus Thermoplasmatota archaeon]